MLLTRSTYTRILDFGLNESATLIPVVNRIGLGYLSPDGDLKILDVSKIAPGEWEKANGALRNVRSRVFVNDSHTDKLVNQILFLSSDDEVLAVTNTPELVTLNPGERLAIPHNQIDIPLDTDNFQFNKETGLDALEAVAVGNGQLDHGLLNARLGSELSDPILTGARFYTYLTFSVNAIATGVLGDMQLYAFPIELENTFLRIRATASGSAALTSEANSGLGEATASASLTGVADGVIVVIAVSDSLGPLIGTSDGQVRVTAQASTTASLAGDSSADTDVPAVADSLGPLVGATVDANTRIKFNAVAVTDAVSSGIATAEVTVFATANGSPSLTGVSDGISAAFATAIGSASLTTVAAGNTDVPGVADTLGPLVGDASADVRVFAEASGAAALTTDAISTTDVPAVADTLGPLTGAAVGNVNVAASSNATADLTDDVIGGSVTAFASTDATAELTGDADGIRVEFANADATSDLTGDAEGRISLLRSSTSATSSLTGDSSANTDVPAVADTLGPLTGVAQGILSRQPGVASATSTLTTVAIGGTASSAVAFETTSLTGDSSANITLLRADASAISTLTGDSSANTDVPAVADTLGPLTGDASADVRVSANAISTADLTGDADADVTASASADATASLTGDSDASVDVFASADATASLTGDADAVISFITATASGTSSLTVTALAGVEVGAVSDGLGPLVGAADGEVTLLRGESSASLSLTGDSSSLVRVSADADSTADLTTNAQGVILSTASSDATSALTGDASGGTVPLNTALPEISVPGSGSTTTLNWTALAGSSGTLNFQSDGGFTKSGSNGYNTTYEASWNTGDSIELEMGPDGFYSFILDTGNMTPPATGSADANDYEDQDCVHIQILNSFRFAYTSPVTSRILRNVSANSIIRLEAIPGGFEVFLNGVSEHVDTGIGTIQRALIIAFSNGAGFNRMEVEQAAPVITGNQLSVSNGTWESDPALTSPDFSYQWRRSSESTELIDQVGQIVSGDPVTHANAWSFSGTTATRGSATFWGGSFAATEALNSPGRFEFTVDNLINTFEIGLATDPVPTTTSTGSSPQPDHGFMFLSNGSTTSASGFPASDNLSSGTVQVGDNFAIVVDDTNTVTIERNGTVFSTSTTTAVFPLRPLIGGLGTGQQLSNLQIIEESTVNVGSNQNTYTPVIADANAEIDCIVTANNGFGGDQTVVASAVGPVIGLVEAEASATAELTGDAVSLVDVNAVADTLGPLTGSASGILSRQPGVADADASLTGDASSIVGADASASSTSSLTGSADGFVSRQSGVAEATADLTGDASANTVLTASSDATADLTGDSEGVISSQPSVADSTASLTSDANGALSRQPGVADATASLSSSASAGVEVGAVSDSLGPLVGSANGSISLLREEADATAELTGDAEGTLVISAEATSLNAVNWQLDPARPVYSVGTNGGISKVSGGGTWTNGVALGGLVLQNVNDTVTFSYGTVSGVEGFPLISLLESNLAITVTPPSTTGITGEDGVHLLLRNPAPTYTSYSVDFYGPNNGFGTQADSSISPTTEDVVIERTGSNEITVTIGSQTPITNTVSMPNGGLYLAFAGFRVGAEVTSISLPENPNASLTGDVSAGTVSTTASADSTAELSASNPDPGVSPTNVTPPEMEATNIYNVGSTIEVTEGTWDGIPDPTI